MYRPARETEKSERDLDASPCPGYLLYPRYPKSAPQCLCLAVNTAKL